MRNEKIIFNLIKSALFGFDGIDERVITEEELCELEEQAVEAIPRELIKMAAASAAIEARWESRIFQVVSKYVKIMRAQQELTKLLMEHGIKPVILKGISAGMYYPNPELRNMGDVDFIVHRELFEKAGKILNKNGYLDGGGYNQRHLCFEKDDVHFEMHHHFSNGMSDECAEFLDDHIENSIDSAVLCSAGNYSWYSFDTCTNGLILLQHISQHLSSGLGLRQVIDWMMYVKCCVNDEIWTELGPMIKSCGNMELARIITKMCELYLGLPGEYPWCEDASEEKCEVLMNFVMMKGNMGKKKSRSSNRTISALNAVNNGIIGRLKYEQVTGMVHWKSTRYHKVLRPFAWIYGIFHHISMLRQDGETVSSILNGIKESKKQRKLIAQLLSNE